MASGLTPEPTRRPVALPPPAVRFGVGGATVARAGTRALTLIGRRPLPRALLPPVVSDGIGGDWFVRRFFRLRPRARFSGS
ncbi:MAG: hypothetical protein O2843_10765, partial [Chloroflexi bacterium]|nr:hypothetical protein [Chloroflexota bacterium]